MRGVILAGYSCQWAEFETMLGLCQKISNVIDAKRAVTPPPRPVEYAADLNIHKIRGLEFAAGSSWVAMTGAEWQEAWKDTADTNYLRGMYTNAMPPNLFSMDDFDPGASNVQPWRNETLDYTAFPN